ncbi:hypothetical protein LPJ73_006456, partial [Coemansia sp. RSA 2703]
FCGRGFARADALSRHTSKGPTCKRTAPGGCRTKSGGSGGAGGGSGGSGSGGADGNGNFHGGAGGSKGKGNGRGGAGGSDGSGNDGNGGGAMGAIGPRMTAASVAAAAAAAAATVNGSMLIPSPLLLPGVAMAGNPFSCGASPSAMSAPNALSMPMSVMPMGSTTMSLPNTPAPVAIGQQTMGVDCFSSINSNSISISSAPTPYVAVVKGGGELNRLVSSTDNRQMLEFSVRHQLVSLDLNFEDRVVKGVTELTIDPHTADLSVIRLHCERPVVRSARINGQESEFRRRALGGDNRRGVIGRVASHKASDEHSDAGNLEIIVPRTVSQDLQTQASRSITVRLEFYVVEPSAGIHFGSKPTVAYTETQMYPSAARQWVPCLDLLHERCTWDLFYSVPACVDDKDEEEEEAGGGLPVTVVSSGELSSLV